MLSAFVNCLKLPELRNKIFITLTLLFIARVGASIPLPGLDPYPLKAFLSSKSASAGGIVGLYNMFTGGAFLKGAVFGLGAVGVRGAEGLRADPQEVPGDQRDKQMATE